MNISVYQDKAQMAGAAASKVADCLRSAIETRGRAVFVVATGNSQIEFLEDLVSEPNIDWESVVMLHLDEYIGIEASHPASFRRYLNERLIRRVPMGQAHLIRGEAPDPQKECERLNELIGALDVDVASIGIGENGHLAFNDPPADFESEAPYAVVELDEACRAQQSGEGWFPSVDDVPRHAISMSIRQIMESGVVVCTVPDARKAKAVRGCLTGEVSPMRPASILQEHDDVHIYLDSDSAGDLFVSNRKGEWEEE